MCQSRINISFKKIPSIYWGLFCLFIFLTLLSWIKQSVSIDLCQHMKLCLGKGYNLSCKTQRPQLSNFFVKSILKTTPVLLEISNFFLNSMVKDYVLTINFIGNKWFITVDNYLRLWLNN